uniref:Tc1-mariner class transposase n=1 Tax=Mycena chlorophos TaxID=658473 RepID=A0ABQ0L7X9_MYCCL|nr:Tc1-mariner class transposase [Mycena chlorophos]
MGNKHISTDCKQCALDLWKQGWAMDDICSAFQVLASSMYRWRELEEEFGTPAIRPSLLKGRERLVALGVLTAIRAIFAHNPAVMLQELQFYLAIHHGLPISISALQATLVCAGLMRKVLRKLAAERDEAHRDEFRACICNPANFSGTGLEFVAIDESSKAERTLFCMRGRSQAGRPAEIRAPFVRGVRYTLTAAMTVKGYIATRFVEESIDSGEFFDFVVEDVMPQMKPYPEVRRMLVLDNCRIVLKDVLNDNSILMLFLPPDSPDLNPIEESFSTWKAFLANHGREISMAEDPILALLESTVCITAAKATAWFRHAGYIW